MGKKRNNPKIPYVIIPWGILMGLLLMLITYAYVFERRLPSKFEYQLFGFISGILFAIMGAVGIYYRDMGKYLRGRPAIIVGIFIIFLGFINIICYWSVIFNLNSIH